jgi:hypothetical protein
MNTTTDKFTTAYIECALWCSTDNSDDSGGEPLDKNYGIGDIASATLERMAKDCKAFQEENRGVLDACGLSLEQQGHNFWLTRNGHGTGFWDRGLPEDISKTLSDASRAYGSFDLYIGDDEQIHS